MSGRRILSLMVALMLIIGCLSMTAFATGGSGAVSGAGIGDEIKGGLGEVYDIINTIALPLAALSFVYAALQFFFGGQQGVEKAKKTMIWKRPVIIITLPLPDGRGVKGGAQSCSKSFAGLWKRLRLVRLCFF